MDHSKKQDPSQVELPFKGSARRPSPKSTAVDARQPLRLIRGQGQKQTERLDSRDAVVRVLIEAGADLLLRRISSERAEDIRQRVDRIMSLFDHVDTSPDLLPALKRQLDELEALMRETRGVRAGKGR